MMQHPSKAKIQSQLGNTPKKTTSLLKHYENVKQQGGRVVKEGFLPITQRLTHFIDD